MLEIGQAIGLYCSDVSGAFDRVRQERIMMKLRGSGFDKRVVDFLESWLRDRRFVVLVSGAVTSEKPLRNSVYQGTVLGPPLWNLFYEDAALATRLLEFIEVIFADDYNCWRGYSAAKSNEEILAQCRLCQASLHRWGEANSVKFDPAKESFHVLHRTRGSGGGV